MSNRNNVVNNSGIETISGGNMPANIYTNADPYISRVSGAGNTVVTPTVTANGHAVEIDGDGGVWDTVSGVAVDINKTNINAINL
jgi:hypothetical protein